MFINSIGGLLKKKAIMLKISRLCGLGASKKVGAGDGLRGLPFFGLAFLVLFQQWKKYDKQDRMLSPTKPSLRNILCRAATHPAFERSAKNTRFRKPK